MAENIPVEVFYIPAQEVLPEMIASASKYNLRTRILLDFETTLAGEAEAIDNILQRVAGEASMLLLPMEAIWSTVKITDFIGFYATESDEGTCPGGDGCCGEEVCTCSEAEIDTVEITVA